MEKVIIFGAGNSFHKLFPFFNQEKDFEIISIWDNNKELWGEKIFLKNQEIVISAPNRNNGDYNIIITSFEYEEEIKEQLINNLGIEYQYIKPWNYCYNYVKQAIIKKYSNSTDEEIKKIIRYLEKHELDIFNYSFWKEKRKDIFQIFRDEECGLLYSYWKNKRIYLKRSIRTVTMANGYLVGIQKEQDMDSPHCYSQPGFEITEKDIVIDAGAAEGFYALEAADRAKKIYIVESDPEWLEALQYTFRPYMAKTEIIPKWLGEQEDDSHTSIDEISKNEKQSSVIIKLDIEGEEINALKGIKKTLQHNSDIRLLICSYHNRDDAKQILEIMFEMDFAVSFSKGYMFFPYNKRVEPELRHGLVLAKKKKHGWVLIWGVGSRFEMVRDAVDYESCIVTGLIDTVQRGTRGNYEIISPEEINNLAYDLIVISVIQYESILEQCRKLGIPRERLYVFWDEKQGETPFINEDKRRCAYMMSKIEIYEKKLLNVSYEYGGEKIPKIYSGKELLNEIVMTHKSLCRFGDGEFEAIRGKERAWFQKTNQKLAIRLLEVLQSDEPHILIAIADNFGNLDKYTEEAAMAIRSYMTHGTTRKDIMRMLDLDKDYYDAYVSRPYMIYKNKTWAKVIFDLMKQLWKNRKLLIVEGENSYMGVGNNLFETAISIRRIECPAKDAYDKYDDILNTICRFVQSDELILITLGPTATVLAYDIARMGVQAIDIGQLDNEYDWYIKGSLCREEIPGKCVAELSYGHKPKTLSWVSQNDRYQREIIARVL